VRATALAAALPDALRQLAPAFGVPAGDLPSWERLTGESAAAAPAAARTSGLVHVAALMAACRDFGSSSSAEQRLATMHGPLASEHFAVALDLFHRRARQLRKPLSLLVLEVGNLDTIAASVGADRLKGAILGLAERIGEMVRRTDPHAVIERDQLAVLAPGCSRDDLPNLAARLRAALEHEPVETEAGPVSAQLAIGMAGASPQDDGSDPNALLRTARAAVSRASTVPDRMFLAA
jgi:GGDEF domain-containing protein